MFETEGLKFLAAVLGFLAAGLGLVVGLIGLRARRLSQVNRDTQNAVLAAGESNQPDYILYAINRIESHYSFKDDLTGEYRKKYLGIRASQEIHNLRIPFYYNATCLNAEIGMPSAKEEAGSPGVTIVDVRHTAARNRVDAFVEIPGVVTSGTNLVGFTVTLPFTKIICASRQEAQVAYQAEVFKGEYLANTVTHGLDSVHMTIVFPNSYKVGPSPIAFIAGSEVIHSSETSRIADMFSFTHPVAQLDVKSPSPNIRYAIHWLPPS